MAGKFGELYLADWELDIPQIEFRQIFIQNIE